MPMNERPRTAHYTCATEICLSYRDDTGALVLLYSSPDQYAKRQQQLGLGTYPQPTSLDPVPA